MPAPNAIVLPQKYYLHYFEYLLNFVQRHYAHMLSPEHQQFAAQFAKAPEDARCLLVRLLNRKPNFFKAQDLAYPEIADLPQALDSLLQLGWLGRADENLPAQWPQGLSTQFGDLLHDLPKPQLLTMAKALLHDLPKPAALPKPELHRALLLGAPPQAVAPLLPPLQLVYKLPHHPAEWFKFLFFGRLLTDDMTQFVLRDMGQTRFVEYDEAQFTPIFQSLAEAEAQFLALKVYQGFKKLRDWQVPPPLVAAWLHTQLAQAAQQAEGLAQSLAYQKLHLRWGEWLEKQQLPQEALQAYELSTMPPARERRVRLWHKLGQTEQAAALARQLLDEPSSAEEYFFARDFLDKLANKKSNKSTTRRLQAADDQIWLPAVQRHYVEGGAVAYFNEQGYEALHTENFIWRSLFGLVFWEVIFAEGHGAIHQPLQRAPSDFYSPNFFAKRQADIEALAQQLAEGEVLPQLVEKNFNKHYGTANPLVWWHESVLPLCLLHCRLLPRPALLAVLLEMAKHPKEAARGFPDLMVWRESEYFFAEIKSPNDQLSGQQLFWLEFFERAGIAAKVVRVYYES